LCQISAEKQPTIMKGLPKTSPKTHPNGSA
jgi:hypothetical protein